MKEVAATEEPPKLDVVVNATVLFSTSTKLLQLFYKPRRRPSKRSKAIPLSRWRVAKTQIPRDLLKKLKEKKQPQNQLKLARANLGFMNSLGQLSNISLREIVGFVVLDPVLRIRKIVDYKEIS